MNCKFCNSEMNEDHVFCPFCGKSQNEEPEQVEIPEEEVPAEEVSAEVVPAENASVSEKKKGNGLLIALGITGVVALLGILGCLLLMAFNVNLPKMALNFASQYEIFQNLLGDGELTSRESYTVDEDAAAKKGDTVVATMGDKTLTNAQLQIYYRMQVMDLISYYGDYISQIGLDLKKPLSEQPCGFDDAEGKTWEQYMLDVAIKTWQNYQGIALLAEEAGFTLDEEWQNALDAMPADLQKQAEEGKYESVDALLQDVIGPGCTEELYLQYVSLAFHCNAYYTSMQTELEPNEEEIEAYFTENEATFNEQGISRDGGNVADVRHILVMPKSASGSEDGTFTEEEWAECLKKAEEILEEWKAGEATEESFADLATKYTEDTGSVETGGLYQDVAPGASYVENFLKWAIDPMRTTGETGIVKTEYGYHIMYYVDGEPYWTGVAGTQLLSERLSALSDSAEEKWPLNVNYWKITLNELKFE